MNLNLKYNATKVDEIEQSKKAAIEECIQDTSIGSLVLFIQKGLIDDNGIHGVSKQVALSTIDEYLKTKDKDELVFDIMGALIKDGFLSRELDIDGLKKLQSNRVALMKQEIENNS